MAAAKSSLVVLVFFSAMANGAQAQSGAQAQTAAPTPFPVCIDDSDCVKLGEGNKYACFQYLCYPWKDDTHIAPKDRRRTCRKDDECEPGQECFRHHDKRQVNRGLCFDEIKNCDTADDCSKGYQCCGGSCCEKQYYMQFADLPCISHLGCQDLGLGRFCCPRGRNQSSECCDVDPNPPTTPYPKSASAIGSATTCSLITPLAFAAILGLLAVRRHN